MAMGDVVLMPDRRMQRGVDFALRCLEGRTSDPTGLVRAVLEGLWMHAYKVAKREMVMPMTREKYDRECAVLSQVMIHEPSMGKLVNKVPDGWFQDTRHQAIWDGCMAVHAAGIPVDVVSVGRWLKDHDLHWSAGGMGYLTELLNSWDGETTEWRSDS